MCGFDGCFTFVSFSVLQMGQEERSGSVEEEGSAEAARWAPLFRQWPERGESAPTVISFISSFTQMDCLSFDVILHDLLSVCSSHQCLLLHLFSHISFLFFFCLPYTHALTLAACRVFVSGAPAPAVSWLLLALAVLQALSKVGDCGRGMCWLSVERSTCPHMWSFPLSAFLTYSSWALFEYQCYFCVCQVWV